MYNCLNLFLFSYSRDGNTKFRTVTWIQRVKGTMKRSIKDNKNVLKNVILLLNEGINIIREDILRMRFFITNYLIHV